MTLTSWLIKAHHLRTLSDSCEDDQGNHEQSHCEWITLKKTACIAFDECIAVVDLTLYKKEIETDMKNRKDTWKSMQKLKCRLKHVFDIFNSTANASLSNKTDNGKNVNFTYPLEFNLSLSIPTGDVQ